MKSQILKALLIFIILPLTLIIIGLAFLAFKLDSEIADRMSKKSLIVPTIYYSTTRIFTPGMQLFQIKELLNELKNTLRERTPEQNLFPGDFSFQNREACIKLTQISDLAEEAHCLAIFWPELPFEKFKSSQLRIAVFNSNGLITHTFAGTPPQIVADFILPPEEIVQYLGDEPILRKPLVLGDIPTDCLNALISIEDQHFLEHKGVSFTGILRAGVKNLVSGRAAQGGSTLTQQLVKNYFLTPEKTLKRKLYEFLMALVLETHVDKDQILETYLNIIYLGQQGVYQIRGYGAASEHYFSKPIQNLNLQECSLLGAIVNSPGLFNPFTHPDKSKKRRDLVLTKMRELHFINDSEMNTAQNSTLPSRPKIAISATAPYFIDAVQRQVIADGFDPSSGLNIFTTLDKQAQESAQLAVNEHLEKLEKDNKKIKKISEEQKINLEGLLISADVSTGQIRALVGGRSFKKSQYNRAIDSHRQVGSTMKPLVYLSALLYGGKNGEIFDPLSPVDDRKVTHKFDGQKWTPENYDHVYHGKVPLFYALKNSLNAPTASLGILVGLDKIISVAQTLGVTSPMQQLPSLSLGAFEIRPIEMLQVYLALAHLGDGHKPLLIDYIESAQGKKLLTYLPEPTNKIDAAACASLVSMLKQTLLSGTAKAVTLSGFTNPAAGKTGTTSDNKDTWFIGFTPHHLALVWTGYDNNTSSGLTGASGSVPIWIKYMKSYGSHFVADDFKWPENTEVKKITREDLIQKGIFPENEKEDALTETLLVFKK
jgi:penicillin-binding protein 1B